MQIEQIGWTCGELRNAIKGDLCENQLRICSAEHRKRSNCRRVRKLVEEISESGRPL
jgi:hypothetical protein